MSALPALAETPMQSAMHSAGPQAAHILDMFNLTVGICTTVFVLVLIAFGYAVWRASAARKSIPADAVQAPSAASERRAGISVVSAVIGSTLLLIFLIVASVFTDRALARMALEGAVHIQVTASQWWWEARYDDGGPAMTFTTANELHVPVGRPIIVTLKSEDVIHSLWVPALHGKKDLIPGRTAQMQFQADKAGTFRGQCAEFCGYQHAWMAFDVVAETPDAFDAWASAQRQVAASPQSAMTHRGQELFMSGTCLMCHAIQGTAAGGQHAPDLTHVASRQWIGAGALRNDRANLERWIRDPQRYKPGANMPASNLGDDDIRALAVYLASLR